MKLEGKSFDVLTFDCYGTLIDWVSGILAGLSKIRGRPPAAGDERTFFDAYLEEEAALERPPYRSYREVLREAVIRLCRRYGFSPMSGDENVLVDGLPDWPPYPDTNAALTALKRRFRLGILSNIDRDLLIRTVKHFPVAFDFVVTAEDVRSYKPAPGHFERGVAAAACGKDRMLHVAQSLFHDIEPCRRLGISCVWINRRGEAKPPFASGVDEFPDLAAFASALSP